MDVNVYMGIVRAVAPAIIAYAVGKGWLPAGSASDLDVMLVSIGAAVWSVKSNTGATK